MVNISDSNINVTDSESLPSITSNDVSNTYGTSSKHYKIRLETNIFYKKNAETMKLKYAKRKRTTSVTFKIGDMATIRVPKIDRSCTDQPRIRTKVIDSKGEKDKIFKLQCEYGIIDGWHRTGELMPYEQAYNADFSCINKVSLRELSRRLNSNRVSRKKCMCKKECSKMCFCMKQGLKCTSHCHPSRSCKNVEMSILSLEDRCRVRNNEELNDQHMNAAQKLLKRQFETNNGLRVTVHNVKSEPTPYIQVFHVNGDHCILAAACSDNGPIEVYDSLSKGKLSTGILKLLRNVHGANVNVKLMNFQQQKGYRDCGLLTIANATSLCLGDDPTSLKYNQIAMRSLAVLL